MFQSTETFRFLLSDGLDSILLVVTGSSLPAHVSPPSYYLTGQPTPGPRQPTANTLQEVQRMRAACSLARRILNEASRLATPGVTTDNIDLLVTELAFEAGAYPSPLNYRHFPKSVCTSGICLST